MRKKLENKIEKINDYISRKNGRINVNWRKLANLQSEDIDVFYGRYEDTVCRLISLGFLSPIQEGNYIIIKDRVILSITNELPTRLSFYSKKEAEKYAKIFADSNNTYIAKIEKNNRR